MNEADIVTDISRTTNLAQKPRRSQADRSAATRAKVIAAARDVLCAQGYSGATMHAIRDAAGMSLGAIQHQFPTKAKLMAAVAAEFSAYRVWVYREAIRRGRSPRESMENLIDANFKMISRPEMAAVLEIHLARRKDPDLDREVGPSTRRFDRRVRLWAYSILRAAGIAEDETHLSVQLLNNAVSRGLTVEYIRNPDAAFIERAVQIWKKQMLDLIFGAGG
ncbi:TetR/AcrR family transcriptional regulator [Sphingopyxis sp. PAMC25046]|uniref:TetR/AcrR family transcriptional regulator n=1 Tax=Sphingopyxis sp. PAMC25046 TaxID=2565556 RepID=UPI00109DB168|nr:TetR/AcrR family transcriptional regulator [Sphingopyxis sp. PAMC25046]QCB53035.1 TetR/AcrR family transcriptional regulator [Sphingopyxis sp. PAMC25046]